MGRQIGFIGAENHHHAILRHHRTGARPVSDRPAQARLHLVGGGLFRIDVRQGQKRCRGRFAGGPRHRSGTRLAYRAG